MTETIISPILSSAKIEYKKDRIRKKLYQEAFLILSFVVKSRKGIYKSCLDYLPRFFEIRMRIFKWAFEENIDFIESYKEVLTKLKEIYSKLNREEEIILIENTIFCINTAMKITKDFLLYSQHSYKSMVQYLDDLLKLTYENIQKAILLEPIPDNLKEIIIRMMDLSLLIDIGILIVMSFISKEIKLSKKKMKELSVLLKDWTQEYGAIAIQLEMWKPFREAVYEQKGTLAEEDLEEEKILVEQGMNEYLKQILNEEKT